MKVLDVFSWLPAKEISIEELEQIFIRRLNGTYEGEYKVLLEMPDNADKSFRQIGKSGNRGGFGKLTFRMEM